MAATLPPKPSPDGAHTDQDAPWRTPLDDAGEPVFLRTYELLKRPPEIDYDFQERAAIARSDGPLVVIRERATKYLIWLSLAWAIVAYVTLVAYTTALDLRSMSPLGLLPLLAISLIFVLVITHRRNVPLQTISDRVSAGLCGRCARRLNTPPNNMGLIRCRPCHRYWSQSRIAPPTADAIADRRTRSHTACYTKDIRGIIAPLAAAFDGPWPTSTPPPNTTDPQMRAPRARALALQRTMAILAVAAVILWLLVSALALAFATPVGILIICLGMLVGGLLVSIELLLVTSPKSPSAWLRSAAHAAATNWLRQWRRPCCDAQFDTMGRWHLWGVASILCERCHCVWQLHDLGKLTLKSVNRCAKCDYDISGLPAGESDSARCPECGTMLLGAVILRCRACQMPLQFRTVDHAHALRCFSCGESNDVRWSIPGSIRPQIQSGDHAVPLLRTTPP